MIDNITESKGSCESSKTTRKNECDQINLLNENLKHVMHATYSAETAMLGWETIYALIEGQLIIGYFSSNKNHIIFWAGLILSVIWLILVDLNHMHQEYRSKAIRNQETILRRCYESAGYSFWSEDICEEQKSDWRLLGIIPVKCIPKYMNTRKMLTSTWSYRKIVPFLLLLFWLFNFSVG